MEGGGRLVDEGSSTITANKRSLSAMVEAETSKPQIYPTIIFNYEKGPLYIALKYNPLTGKQFSMFQLDL